MKIEKSFKILSLLMLILMIILAFTGCADVSHVEQCLPATDHVYGFWGGVWHGMILQFAFIGSLFSDDIAVYAVNNNGGWYNFGFVGGFGIMLRIIGLILKGNR